MNLIFMALAPVFIIALYVYYRDKYEKEPWRMLFTTLIIGALLAIPVIFVERFFSLFTPSNPIRGTLYTAFVIAGFTEEGFKFLAFILLIWKSREFNEKFDGIVYAVFISLGFAGIENILYVTQGGAAMGLFRALTAVPAHALFGITMGYYFGLALFYPAQRRVMIIMAFLIPFLLHGFYDFCLMSQNHALLTLFVPFVIYLWISGFRKIKVLSDHSIYKGDMF